ncbi:hypothetical protein F3Y22_tig00111377pilonHSYRG00033 [Hibiscus syriacus]|uniref:Fe2OG dioxygenase domain-containing protein n=1 Tax=Hibiscus syriacus TaxID=106335 RepID=A0A6A2YMV8_HIBSY|nr:probable 2-oxoglutarate-dependent dioxygenase AOP1 [Hibiscus syriacus]KAE8680602.1 hypothetical protein F3Y22_tig00111377pilonHSYRG00033 [Hibiscus syriacus]
MGELPVIDFSDQHLKPGSPEWDSVRTRVQQALEEYGCFEASYEKSSSELRKAEFEGLNLFELPLETKMKNVSDNPSHAYIAPHANALLYESIGIEDPNVAQNVESLPNSFWPHGNTNFMSHFITPSVFLVHFCENFDVNFRDILQQKHGMDGGANARGRSNGNEDGIGEFWAMKYKAPNTSEKKLQSRDHTDKNIVTVLCQGIQGLEIQLKNGEWVAAKPHSSTVFFGDSVHAWLNGRLQPPYHRVMMKGKEARYSFGLFPNPKKGYLIKAPQELVEACKYAVFLRQISGHSLALEISWSLVSQDTTTI